MMIAEENYLKELAEKEESRILVVSDSHGYKENLEKVLTSAPKCDALFFLGDGIQDVLEIYEEDFLLKSGDKRLPPALFFVKGNGDKKSYSYSADEVRTVEIQTEEIARVSGKKIFLTHGHLYDVYYTRNTLLEAVRRNRCAAGFFGHTHVPYQDVQSKILLLNPGSCSRPRNYSEKSYVIATVKKNSEAVDYRFFSI